MKRPSSQTKMLDGIIVQLTARQCELLRGARYGRNGWSAERASAALHRHGLTQSKGSSELTSLGLDVEHRLRERDL